MSRLLITLFVLLEGAVLAGVWWIWRTSLYEVYVFYIFGLLLLFLAQWPKPNWLGIEHAETARSKVEDRAQPVVIHPATVVKDLAESNSIFAFFNAIVRLRDTEEICEEIRGSLIPKGIAYALFTVFLLFVVPHEEFPKNPSTQQALQDLLKAWGAFSAFALLVVWDIAICWLHYRRNKAAEREVLRDSNQTTKLKPHGKAYSAAITRS